MEGDTTKATSILACAHNCTAWDECCSFEFNEDDDEACSLNAACRPTRNVPGKLFCTRGPICPQGYKPQTDRRFVTYENYKKLEQCAKNCTADIIDGVHKNCKGFRLKPSNEKKPLSK